MLARLGGWLFQQPYLLACITYMTWALNIVLGRYVAGHIPPTALSFFRWSIAFLIVLPFAWPHLKRDWPVIRRHLPILIVFSITGISCFNTMTYWGLQYSQALNALLLQTTAPLLIALWAFLMFGDRLTARQVIGIAASLLGVVIVVCRGDIEVIRSISFNRGDIWFFGALLIFAFYSALTKTRPAMHQLSFLALTMGVGAFVLIPLYMWEMSIGRVAPADTTTVLAIVYVATFPSLIAYFCYNRALELIGPNRVGALFPLVVVFGAIFAIVLLGERPQLYHAIGCALIVGGAIVATRKARAAATENA